MKCNVSWLKTYPVIRARVVAFLQDDLRRQVQRSTAEGVGPVIRD